MCLCLVAHSGMGTTACCFLGHSSLLENAGAEEKTAREGGERADDESGVRQHFTSEHQAHSAWPEGPDEPSQQSGIHSLLPQIHSQFTPFLAHTNPSEEVTLMSDEKLFCFLLQMSYMNSSWTKPTSRTPLNPQTRSKTVWDSRVEGYVILRDLDLYLTKLARDFLLLASKTHFWLKTKPRHPDNTHTHAHKWKKQRSAPYWNNSWSSVLVVLSTLSLECSF